jgi:hypothetical protein
MMQGEVSPGTFGSCATNLSSWAPLANSCSNGGNNRLFSDLSVSTTLRRNSMDVILYTQQWQDPGGGCGLPRVPVSAEGNATNCMGPPLATFFNLPIGDPFFTPAQGGLCGSNVMCTGPCADSSSPVLNFNAATMWAARVYRPIPYATSRSSADPPSSTPQAGLSPEGVGLVVLGVAFLVFFCVTSAGFYFAAKKLDMLPSFLQRNPSPRLDPTPKFPQPVTDWARTNNSSIPLTNAHSSAPFPAPSSFPSPPPPPPPPPPSSSVFSAGNTSLNPLSSS